MRTLITAFAYGWIYTWMSVTSKAEREINTSTFAALLAMELNTFKGVRIAESGADCELLVAETIFRKTVKLFVTPAIFPFTDHW